MRYWFALLLAVVANVVANVALKFGVGHAKLDTGWRSMNVMVGNVWIWIGLIAAVVLLGCYLYAIRGIAVSIAYPVVTGLAAVGIAFLAASVLDEPMNISNVAGIALIILGVTLLSGTLD